MEAQFVAMALLGVAVFGLAIRIRFLGQYLDDARAAHATLQETRSILVAECDSQVWVISELAYEVRQATVKVESHAEYITQLQRDTESARTGKQREIDQLAQAIEIQDEEMRIVRAELQQEIQSKASLVEQLNRCEDSVAAAIAEPAKPKSKRGSKKKAT